MVVSHPKGSSFRALWTHRYYKYTHIIGKYRSYAAKYRQLRRLKNTLGGKPLVAIILSEQMGDIIACEPVAREVRRRHPDGHIIWVVKAAYAELVKYHPDLNGYLIEKCPSERMMLIRSGIYDQVYNLHISHRKCKYCPEDIVNPTADAIDLTFDNYYHRGNLLYMFSQAAGLLALDEQPRMYIPDSVKQQINALNLPTEAIVIHTQSSHIARDWPADNWNRLVSWMLATYPNPIIEVGIQPMVTVDHPRFINLCGRLSLLETAEVIRRARLFIGIDSGPAHMANAGNTEGILLLGKLFDFVDYMPYSGRYKRGEGVTILNNFDQPCATLPYDWVEKAVQKHLGHSV
ncbi:glycosyltransferase family 9 protein [Spirosoma pomorum]